MQLFKHIFTWLSGALVVVNPLLSGLGAGVLLYWTLTRALKYNANNAALWALSAGLLYCVFVSYKEVPLLNRLFIFK